MRFKFVLGIVIWLLLTACKAPVEENEPIIIPEKPAVWTVGFTESTAWLIDFLPACAESAPRAGILVHHIADPESREEDLDLVFTWGAVDSQFQNAVILIESEELVIVVHPDVPYRELTKEQAAGLLSGKITDWGNLNPLSSFAGPVSLWRYLPGSDAEQGLQAVMGIGLDGTTNLAANADVMLDAIQSNQFSIGYLPAHRVTDNLGVAALSDSDPLTLPVLVAAQSPITPEQNAWLACLQQEIDGEQELTP